jgi:lysophospholipase L1-like esterase
MLLFEAASYARSVHPLKAQILRFEDGSTKKQRIISISEKGLRAPNFRSDKLPEKIRIFVIGGSSVFDATGNDGEDWPKQLEKNLYSKGLSQIEVINAGIGGHATADSVGLLLTEYHRYKPDIIILYSTWNDIKLFRLSTSLVRTIQPYDRLKDPFRNYMNWFDELASYSRLYEIVRFMLLLRKYAPTAEGRILPGSWSNQLSPLMQEQFRLNIATFIDVSRSIGALPIVALEGRLADSKNTEKEKAKIQYSFAMLTPETLLKAYQFSEETIRAVTKEKATPLLSSASKISGQGEFFLDHVHLSQQGSKRLAEEMAHELTPIIHSFANQLGIAKNSISKLYEED